MTGEAPAVFTIPSGVSFVDALAEGLLARWGESPVALSRAVILLPTRRACRSLRDAFLRASAGRPLLLPRMVPLGDLDADELLLSADEGVLGEDFGADLPPAMSPLRRQLLLTRLILGWSRTGLGRDAGGRGVREDQAARLAAELARLLDQVETEGLTFARLSELVPEDYAEHWQVTLDFLKVLTERWPEVLAAEGTIGPAERRRRLLEMQAEAWRAEAPDYPVIVAGSTGSIPATAGLIATVAGLPSGEVVLPGLDPEADDATWAAVCDEPTHPQHGLAVLLERLAVPRQAVADWPWAAADEPAAARAAFANWSLRPAAMTAAWPDAAQALPPETVTAALSEVRRIDCAAPGEEAAVIALTLREAVERPGRTAALVTPDRGLARRVAAELRRWGTEIDDSAGVPLGDTPPGRFLRLTAQMTAGSLAPVELLAALKHPLALGGLPAGGFRRRVRALETAALRGPRPGPGFDGLLGALRSAGGADELLDWVRGLADLEAPFAEALSGGGDGLTEIVTAHLTFAEALAAGAEETGPERLWHREAGEAAAAFMAELREAGSHGPALRGERYPALLSTLMAARVVRPRYGGHPRLAILGPLEVRLQHYDLIVLGGLNEGTWPAEVDPGPWLSRPMRARFGLPPPERRIGLSAHDFAQGFAAPAVVLTRSARVEGTPTVPSRWLLRIDALLHALDRKDALQVAAGQSLAWAAALDRPERVAAAPPPAPRPPVSARPRRLSVTQVETWMRDPYALYARKVLGLEALDPIDADPGAAERGTLVHMALEAYLRAHPAKPPANPEAALIAEGRRVFEAVRAKPGIWAFWWPRFLRIAHWFADADQRRRAESRSAAPEVRGELRLEGPAGDFLLTATADRIERLFDGRLAIVDYKTGALPKQRELELGFAPQLPLEAAIARAGGFQDMPAADLAELAFWRLSGGEPPGEIITTQADPMELAEAALEGLRRLVSCYDDPESAYHSVPRPDWAPRFSDYAHLARVKEWSAGIVGGDTVS
jgi:ATP-dependent helicase/nuclease subunit B